jgi:hypothetical protein
MLVISLIGWPVSSILTWNTEPQFVLALSWIAIILTCLDGLWVAQVDEKGNDE